MFNKSDGETSNCLRHCNIIVKYYYCPGLIPKKYPLKAKCPLHFQNQNFILGFQRYHGGKILVNTTHKKNATKNQYDAVHATKRQYIFFTAPAPPPPTAETAHISRNLLEIVPKLATEKVTKPRTRTLTAPRPAPNK